MPCVCLSNTFRQWQSIKSSTLELRKQKRAQKLAHQEQRHQCKQAQKTARQDRRQQRKLDKRQSRLAQKRAKRLSKRTPKQAPTIISPKLSSAPSRKITEETLHIPHPRKAIVGTATVSQTLTAAISTRMLTPKPAPTSEPSLQSAPAHAPTASPRRLPANVMNVQPIRPAEIKPGASRADLINAESQLGSCIFGPIPYGHRREFFHDRKNIWIWHEDWHDQAQNLHQLTVRYEVRTSGVYKKISTGKYLRLEGDELDNFCKATKAYLYLIKKYLYKTPSMQAA